MDDAGKTIVTMPVENNFIPHLPGVVVIAVGVIYHSITPTLWQSINQHAATCKGRWSVGTCEYFNDNGSPKT